MQNPNPNRGPRPMFGYFRKTEKQFTNLSKIYTTSRLRDTGLGNRLWPIGIDVRKSLVTMISPNDSPDLNLDHPNSNRF